MQFDPYAKIIAGRPGEPGREWTGLRTQIRLQATDGKQPNRLQVKLYNLSEDSRAFLHRDGTTIQAFAGYDSIDNVELIGTGEVTRIKPEGGQGGDRVTTIECSDGRGAYNSRVHKSWGSKISAKSIIKDVAKSMGADEADLEAVDDVELPQGLTLDGKARDAMDQLTSSVGADWQIERGGLIVLPKGEPSSRRAILLSDGTGLIGSPQRTKKGIKVKALMNARIRIRRILRIDSMDVEGFWMVRSYTHDLDTHGQNWYTTAEATRIDGG